MTIKNAGLTAVLATAGLLGATSVANAAIGGMSNSTQFWEGAYAGADIGTAKPSVTNNWRSNAYDVNDVDQTNHRNRVDGAGAVAGIHVGFSKIKQNMMFGKDWLWGIEGSYMPTNFRNTTLYDNESVMGTSEQSIYEMNSISTVRARMGLFIDDVMVVGSAGLSQIDSRYGASVEYDDGDGDIGTFIGFNRVNPLLGVAAHYRMGEAVSLKLAVDHHLLYERRNTANLGGGSSIGLGRDSYVRQNGLTTAYVGMSYHFH